MKSITFEGIHRLGPQTGTVKRWVDGLSPEDDARLQVFVQTHSRDQRVRVTIEVVDHEDPKSTKGVGGE